MSISPPQEESVEDFSDTELELAIMLSKFTMNKINNDDDDHANTLSSLDIAKMKKNIPFVRYYA